ncbi:MAG: DNA gyrase/topoisomerase IV subunit A [Bacteroidales bacterium]|nr:DNA gyrase/topoisomerase IV subunit A [Bacteroidales bacterium]
MSQEEIDKIEGLPEEEDKNGVQSELAEHQKSTHVTKLSGMYQDWFLDYASYVILERAVPHIDDGLKPVQRRILHAMRRMDDGRYNKVANVIGYTMQYHPHGDASIGDALVQLGQKDLLIDCQGNWGNLLTGDGSAAPRYIEARLTKFAIDVVFNPKTTEWKLSYDGRNKEPITLPVKFPLLLMQGVEGIAVGLASKILPHNFIELCDASIAYLEGKPFELYPDFPTGGMVDVSKYNDGIRGGAVKIRAKISKIDNKTLSITEIPFGKTTGSLIESIVKANEKGKIKIKKIDDNTAANVEILISLAAGVSPDKTIDALYAFTDCEVSVSPNTCVIEDNKPHFIGVSDILRHSADHTRELLMKELEIRLDELNEEWHLFSLERIFIENELYEHIKTCKTEEEILETIDESLKPFVVNLRREVTREDLIRLSNIPIKRISKYSSFKADDHIKGLEVEMEEIKNHIRHIVPYTINYIKQIKKKYSKNRERKTEIRSFDTIEATHVVVANARLYVNREEGFIGTGLRKEEFVCDCSDIDDIIVIRGDGKYLISKVADKAFVGKDIIHVAVFRKNDSRTIYNVVYRDGMKGAIMAKRCSITGLTRDKEYDLSKGSEGSKILHLTSNPNGEAEILKISLKPRPRLRNLHFDYDFSQLAIKGKNSMGNILTKYAIHRIELKEKIGSTLGGQKIWFDTEVQRLNTEARGNYIGEFQTVDRIIVFYDSGMCCTYKPELMTHFDEGIVMMEKYVAEKVYTAVYLDVKQNYHYVKRFVADLNGKPQYYLPDDTKVEFVHLSAEDYPLFRLIFGGKHKDREAEELDVEPFIAVKGFKAKGKRLSNFQIKSVEELEPVRFKEETNPFGPDGEPEDDEEDFPPETEDADQDMEEDDIPFEVEEPVREDVAEVEDTEEDEPGEPESDGEGASPVKEKPKPKEKPKKDPPDKNQGTTGEQMSLGF